MIRFLSGNRVTLLRNGSEYFPALEAAIHQARQQIFLETYIFEPDQTGLRIAEALKQAAKRGVKVCLLLDGFGGKNIPRAFMDGLQQAGIDVLVFRPKVSPWTLKRRRLRRLHRKIVVIDGRTAFVGGINIIDDMNTPGHTPPRVDYATQVEGPLLNIIHASARRLWRRVSWTALRRVVGSRSARSQPIHGGVRAAFVMRDNIWHRRDIEQAYLTAIDNAHSEIVIANSYFLPGVRFRHALIAAAARGVRVVLLLQARVEYLLLDYASHALYGQLLAGGIEIHEYHASFMHSKVAVIDGRWATVGSSNIDPFSLLLSREANVVVVDAHFAGELREDLTRAMRDCAHRVHQDDWAHAPRLRKLLSWTAYGLMRLMLGVLGISTER